MSVSAIPSAAAASFERPAGKPEYKKINIDWDKFAASAGMKLNDVIVCDFLADKTQPTVVIDDLIKSGVDIKKTRIEGKPPFYLTFKTAVQCIIDSINEGPIDSAGDVTVEWSRSKEATTFYDIMYRLTSADTPSALRLYKETPNHHYVKNSARMGHTALLFGAIIHMLYDAGLIRTYGEKGSSYWVGLNTAQAEGKV